MAFVTYPKQIVNYRGIPEHQLRSSIPAIYADEKHESRSDRYVFVSTERIMNMMGKFGLVPILAMQSVPRKKIAKPGEPPIETEEQWQDRLAHTAHLIQFAMPLQDRNQREMRSVVLRNSAIGNMSYRINEGYVGTICTNGMVSGMFDVDMRYLHINTVVEEIEAETQKILQSQVTPRLIEMMKATEVTRDEQLLLAEQAMRARFLSDEPEEEENVVEGSLVPSDKQEKPLTGMDLFQPTDFIRPFHYQDRDKQDLHTIINSIQEGIVHPGGKVYTRRYNEKTKKHQKHTLHDVNEINESVRLTKEIMRFGEMMLMMKQGMTYEQMKSYLGK